MAKPKAFSNLLPSIVGDLEESQSFLLIISQTRANIDPGSFEKRTRSGGKALKFYASVRIDIRRIETLKDGANPIGNRTRAKIVKNKMAPPFKQAEFDILYGEGISVEGGILDLAVDHNVVKKSGAWFTYEGDQLGQGKENVRRFLKDNPELCEEIKYKTMVKLGIVEADEEPEEVASDSVDPLDDISENF